MLTLSLSRPAPVKRTPAAPYVPVAAQVGMGFRSSYAPRPTVPANMLVIMMHEARLITLAWWCANYQAVGVHGRNGKAVGSYLRRRPARLYAALSDEAVEAQCDEYDRLQGTWSQGGKNDAVRL